MTVPIPVLQAPPETPANEPALRGWPIWRLGFRPFYLGAALFAALAVPLWMAMLTGAVQLALPVPSLLWHAHEMIYGFAVAVIVGFLLTAGKAWTGRQTSRGAALAMLFVLWLAARMAPFVAPYAVVARRRHGGGRGAGHGRYLHRPRHFAASGDGQHDQRTGLARDY